jgi:hypothetical protein
MARAFGDKIMFEAVGDVDRTGRVPSGPGVFAAQHHFVRRQRELVGAGARDFVKPAYSRRQRDVTIRVEGQILCHRR